MIVRVYTGKPCAVHQVERLYIMKTDEATGRKKGCKQAYLMGEVCHAQLYN